MKKRIIILWIIILVIADQGTKLIIANYFMDTRFDIIDSVIGIRPIFNEKYTFFNVLLGLNLEIFARVVFCILVQFAIIFSYGYIKTIQQSSTKLLDIAFIFGQSVAICVFCGFFFWKSGVLDFIYLHFFIIDMKDIYIKCFVMFFLINYLKNYSELKSPKLKFKDYLQKCYINIKNNQI